MGARMGCELPRHRSCLMTRFRGCFRNSSPGCWCTRSLSSAVEEGSVRSCSERGPAGAGPMKENKQKGGRERKREIPSKRRDDPWPWLKRGKGSAVVWIFRTSRARPPHHLVSTLAANSPALPHRATLPHACSSLFENLLSRPKFLGYCSDTTNPASSVITSSRN